MGSGLASWRVQMNCCRDP